jgi:hypothetical protein
MSILQQSLLNTLHVAVLEYSIIHNTPSTPLQPGYDIMGMAHAQTALHRAADSLTVM